MTNNLITRISDVAATPSEATRPDLGLTVIAKSPAEPTHKGRRIDAGTCTACGATSDHLIHDPEVGVHGLCSSCTQMVLDEALALL